MTPDAPPPPTQSDRGSDLVRLPNVRPQGLLPAAVLSARVVVEVRGLKLNGWARRGCGGELSCAGVEKPGRRFSAELEACVRRCGAAVELVDVVSMAAD
jgi:hypothetical protein